ncbi:unknown [Anaerotruncus sp. CAG:390]|nr:unknown [Anaerotruncus sp. CAG:390]
MRKCFGSYLELIEHLIIAFEDLDGVPSLLLLGQTVNRSFLDVSDRMLDTTGEGVLRNGLYILCSVDRGIGCFHDTGPLKSRDLNDLASELT